MMSLDTPGESSPVEEDIFKGKHNESIVRSWYIAETCFLSFMLRLSIYLVG